MKNIEEYILRGQSMIMCAKVSQKEVIGAIRELGEFGARPEGMAVDPDAMIYHKQYDIDYEAEGNGQSAKASGRLKLNLYFDCAPYLEKHEASRLILFFVGYT